MNARAVRRDGQGQEAEVDGQPPARTAQRGRHGGRNECLHGYQWPESAKQPGARERNRCRKSGELGDQGL
ncbi:hypothetical protein MASR2M50_17790 [Thauera sp.]